MGPPQLLQKQYSSTRHPTGQFAARTRPLFGHCRTIPDHGGTLREASIRRRSVAGAGPAPRNIPYGLSRIHAGRSAIRAFPLRTEGAHAKDRRPADPAGPSNRGKPRAFAVQRGAHGLRVCRIQRNRLRHSANAVPRRAHGTGDVVPRTSIGQPPCSSVPVPRCNRDGSRVASP